MARVPREEYDLSGEESQGWSPWVKAMIPDGPRNGYEERNSTGLKRSDIVAVFPVNALDGCGIYEWKARGPLPDEPENSVNRMLENFVVYVGSTCRDKPGSLNDRILEYLNNGSHKGEKIDEALDNDYELWVRVKGTKNSRVSAEKAENNLLDKYDYAWNFRRNGEMRDIL